MDFKTIINLIKEFLKIKPKGTGFNPYFPYGEDRLLGSTVGKRVLIPNGHGWGKYLSNGELQNRGREKYTCTNHASNRQLQTTFNWLIANEPTNQIVNILQSWGGIVEGKVNLSDRFQAWASGTGVFGGGNNYKNNGDSFRHNGFLFEHEWPYVDDNNEFISAPPLKLIQLARYRASVFDIQYEFVAPDQQVNALPTGTVATCGHAWPNPVNGIYRRIMNAINHAFLFFEYVLNTGREMSDTYLDAGKDGDFTKTLAWDYNLGYGMQLFVTLKKNFNQIEINKLIQRGLKYIIRALANGEIYELTSNGLKAISAQEWNNLNVKEKEYNKELVGITEDLYLKLLV